jgi:ATP-binding cassette subfamily F protein uup
VLEAVENVALRVDLAGGREISASQLCERLGFDYEGQQKMVRDLSGGEKRRLQLTRLLMASPNVLLLDEPTNDFDVETLTALEDLLDTYAGVIIVISHDRYFLERVCDRFVGLLGNETLQDLALGIEQYLELRAEMISRSVVTEDRKEISGAAQLRLVKKELAKVEKQLERVIVQEQELIKEQESASFDHQRLLEVGSKLTDIVKVRSELEDKWLELSGQVKE